MQRRRLTLLALMAAFLLALAGCGSSGGSGGDQTKVADGEPGGSVEDAQTVGLNVCTNCHAGQTDQWVDGPHANVTGLYGAPATIEDATGFPSYDYFSDESCAGCHDELGDGQRLTAELTGSVARPVIGCESCHGGGQLHYGIGPLAYAQPDAARCGECHNSTVDHEAYHPEATAIYEKVLASPHYAGGGYPYVMGDDGTVNPRCSKCHTDEGAKLYKGISGTLGHDDLVDAFEGKADLVEPNPIQCRTCHDAHNPNELLIKASDTASAEFLTCTNCHQVKDSYHGENNKYSWSGYSVGVGAFDGTKIIYDTHFDDDATPEIEGYNLDPTNERVCRDCHDVHSADLIINEQWASSSHGGHLLEVKEADGADPLTAAAGEAEAPAFVHYDFKADNRADCQKCHTSTGFKNYAADPAAYQAAIDAFVADPLNPSPNDFGNLAGEQREMLYCATCHTDNAGGMRNPGATTLTYTVDSLNPTLPDLGAANVCINCHSGRGNMDSLVAPIDVDPAADMSALSPGFGPGTTNATKTHYLAAAGTLFQATTVTGYEYPGQTYAPGYFRHDDIGTPAEPGTGTSGPCVACHMASEDSANHTFAVVDKDADGVITNINSAACSACHAGHYGPAFLTQADIGKTFVFDDLYSSPTTTTTRVVTQADIDAGTDFLQTEAEGYHGALAALENGLLDNGLAFTGSYPYFSGLSWKNQGVFGAAHNYNYLHHEPGAYAHNRQYTKVLIFDSIDWLDNFALDGTITLDPVADDHAIHWFGGDAVTGIVARP